MSYRYMRIIVFFDLPTVTSAERKEYARFRKHLVKNGFMMMQESVYCKIALNSTAAMTIIENVRNNKPSSGLVQLLTITEKQYSRIELVIGDVRSDVLDTDDRLVVI